MAQDITTLPRPTLQQEVKERLMKPAKFSGRESKILAQGTQNPSVERGQYRSNPHHHANVRSSHEDGNGAPKKGSARRYFAAADDGKEWPPELNDYNKRFSQTLEGIKRRHDGVVTTIGKLH
jgi:pyruvate dehydrogenase kinase 2/3/4